MTFSIKKSHSLLIDAVQKNLPTSPALELSLKAILGIFFQHLYFLKNLPQKARVSSVFDSFEKERIQYTNSAIKHLEEITGKTVDCDMHTLFFSLDFSFFKESYHQITNEVISLTIAYSFDHFISKPTTEVSFSSNYHDFTNQISCKDLRNIHEFFIEEKELLEKLLFKIKIGFKGDDLIEICHLLNQRDPQFTDLQSYRIHLALAAQYGFLKGEISLEITLCFFYLLPIANIAVFVEDFRSLNLQRKIALTLTDTLSGEQIDRLFTQIGKLPFSSRLVFSYPTKITGQKNETISLRLKKLYNFNPFNFIEINKVPFRFLVSTAVFDEFVKLKFAHTYSKSHPVLGISSPAQIRLNAINGTRDIGLAYVSIDETKTPKIIKEKMADSLICEETDFQYHDFYHLFSISSIPKKYKILAIQFADIISDFAKKNRSLIGQKNYQACLKISWQFKDMDFSFFHMGKIAGKCLYKTFIDRFKLPIDDFIGSPELCFIQSLLNILRLFCEFQAELGAINYLEENEKIICKKIIKTKFKKDFDDLTVNYDHFLNEPMLFNLFDKIFSMLPRTKKMQYAFEKSLLIHSLEVEYWDTLTKEKKRTYEKLLDQEKKDHSFSRLSWIKPEVFSHDDKEKEVYIKYMGLSWLETQKIAQAIFKTSLFLSF